MKHEISLVDESKDEVLYLDEIDIQALAPEFKAVQTDDFRKINVTKHSKKVQKDFSKLQKRFVGVEGAESKYLEPEMVDGYSLFDVIEPPYNLDALGALYDENAILHAVVDSRVMNTVGLGFHWTPTLKSKKQIEKGSDNEDKAERIRTAHQKEQDRLNQIFDSLNEEESFIETMIRIWQDVLTLGNGYMEIGRTNSGKVGYIGHVPGRLVRVRRGRDGFVQSASNKTVFFRHYGDTKTVDPINGDPSPNEMLHFKMYTPNNSYYGVPPSVAALAAIVGDKFAKEYNIDYFENKAIPRYAIILKGVKLSEKSKRELIQYFRQEIKGKHHGTLVIPLPATIGGNDADVRFEKLEADTQEGSFDQYRKSNRDEVISAYRVPPTKVGVFENANLAVSRDADKTFKSQVVGPDQIIAEKRVNRIVQSFTDLFKLEFEQLDVLDEDLKSRIHDRYLRAEVLTPNEVRTDIGKEPHKDGGRVLPYVTKTKLKKPYGYLDAADMKPAGGAPTGNSNSGTPAKSGQDNGTNASDKDQTGTNAERGEVQDSSGTRERS